MEKTKIPFTYIGTKKRWWDDKVEFNGIIYVLPHETHLPPDVFKKAKEQGKVKEIKKEIKEKNDG